MPTELSTLLETEELSIEERASKKEQIKEYLSEKLQSFAIVKAAEYEGILAIPNGLFLNAILYDLIVSTQLWIECYEEEIQAKRTLIKTEKDKSQLEEDITSLQNQRLEFLHAKLFTAIISQMHPAAKIMLYHKLSSTIKTLIIKIDTLSNDIKDDSDTESLETLSHIRFLLEDAENLGLKNTPSDKYLKFDKLSPVELNKLARILKLYKERIKTIENPDSFSEDSDQKYYINLLDLIDPSQEKMDPIRIALYFDSTFKTQLNCEADQSHIKIFINNIDFMFFLAQQGNAINPKLNKALINIIHAQKLSPTWEEHYNSEYVSAIITRQIEILFDYIYGLLSNSPDLFETYSLDLANILNTIMLASDKSISKLVTRYLSSEYTIQEPTTTTFYDDLFDPAYFKYRYSLFPLDMVKPEAKSIYLKKLAQLVIKVSKEKRKKEHHELSPGKVKTFNSWLDNIIDTEIKAKEKESTHLVVN